MLSKKLFRKLFFIILFFSFEKVSSQIIIVADINGKKIESCDIYFYENENLVFSSFTDSNGFLDVSSLQMDKEYLCIAKHIGYFMHEKNVKLSDTNFIYLREKNYELQQAVVTGQIFESDISQSFHRINLINKHKIERLAAVNLSDVVKMDASLSLNNDNILGSSLSIQGLSGQNIKILIDNVPVIGRLGGNIDLGHINLSNIERIEIVEGPLSVNYGTDALAGTINLISSKTLTQNQSLKLSSYYESVGKYNITSNYMKKIGINNFSILVGRNYFDGWSKSEKFTFIPRKNIADSSRYQQWNPKEQYFITFNDFVKLGSVNMTIKNSFFFEEITNKGYPRQPYYINAFDDFYKTWRNSTSLNFDILNDDNKSNFLVSYDTYKRRKNTFFVDLTTLNQRIVNDQSMQDTIGFSNFFNRASIASKKNKNFKYEIGYNLNMEVASGRRITGGEKNLSDFAFFSNLDINVKDYLRIKPGIRYSYNSKYDVPLIPSINLLSEINDVKLRLSLAKGFRSPTLKELYFEFVDINHNIIGNQNLESEISDHISYEMSKNINNNSANTTVSIFTYYNDIKNLITLAENGNLYTYVNVGRYKTRGGSFKLNFKKDLLTIDNKLNFSGINSSVDADDTYYYSVDNSSFVTFFSEMIDSEIVLSFSLRGKSKFLTLNSDDEIVENKRDSYQLLDLSFSKKYYENKLKIILGFKNLFNVTDVGMSNNSQGFHQQSESMSISYGRSFFVSLNYSFL